MPPQQPHVPRDGKRADRPPPRAVSGSAGSTEAVHIAGRRAFFLTFSITELRDPFRRDRRGATGLEVVLGEVPVDAAGEERGRGGKISADQARALCGMIERFPCRAALNSYGH